MLMPTTRPSVSTNGPPQSLGKRGVSCGKTAGKPARRSLKGPPPHSSSRGRLRLGSPQRGRKFHVLILAMHEQAEGLFGWMAANGGDDLLGRFHRVAVDLPDFIAGVEAGLGRGTVAGDVHDAGARLAASQLDAEPSFRSARSPAGPGCGGAPCSPCRGLPAHRPARWWPRNCRATAGRRPAR